jgi:hypothetical protein
VYENGEAHLRRLDVEADDGAQVAVRAGLNVSDQLILNPPIGLVDGMRVTTRPRHGPLPVRSPQQGTGRPTAVTTSCVGPRTRRELAWASASPQHRNNTAMSLS